MWDAAIRGDDIRGGAQRASAAPGAAMETDRQKSEAEQRRQTSQTDQWTPGRREAEQPSLWEMMKDAQERAEAMREKFSKLKAPVNYGEIPIEACSRLAKARTHRDVGSAEGYARRQISRLKAALRQDPDNRDAIRAAMAQLEKAICRAGRKKNKLDQEHLIRLKSRRAEKNRRAREELRLRQELKRRQASRFVEEKGYINEAAINQQMLAGMAAETAKWQLSMPQFTPSPEQGAVAYAVAAAEPAATVGGGVEIQA